MKINNLFESNMPEPLWTAFRLIATQVLVTYADWNDMLKLVDNEDYRNIIDLAVPGFEGTLNFMYWNTTTLAICRLSDPPAFKTNENLTFEYLISLIGNPELKARIQGIYDGQTDAIRLIKANRVQRLAHNDLDTLVEGTKRPLKKLTVGEVEPVLVAFGNILNEIRMAYDGVPFEITAHVRNKIDQLVLHLTRSLTNPEPFPDKH